MVRTWEYDINQLAYIADDGNWLEYGSFGQDTYGLHTKVDGRESVICMFSETSVNVPAGYNLIDETDKLLDKIANGWHAVNWENCSITEAANMLGVTRQRVHAMIKANILEAEKIGNQWIIKKSSVEKRLSK